MYLTSWLQGHLVSIHTEAENQFIFDSFHDRAERSIWIGAKKVNSIWTWSDGTVWDYNNWCSTDCPSGDGDCVEIVSAWNAWNDLPCADLLDLPFVCQTTSGQGNNQTSRNYMVFTFNISLN